MQPLWNLHALAAYLGVPVSTVFDFALCQTIFYGPSTVANSASDSSVLVNYWVEPSKRSTSSSSSTSQPSRF